MLKGNKPRHVTNTDQVHTNITIKSSEKFVETLLYV